MTQSQDESLWVHIAYKKQEDGKIVCQLTSNIPLERGVDLYDMKVYSSDEWRVYEHFAVAPGGTIHIDVYADGGESTGMRADFKVTDQAVEVEESDGIEVSVSPQEPEQKE